MFGYLEKTIEDILKESGSGIDRDINLPSRVSIGMYTKDEEFLEKKILDTTFGLGWHNVYIATGIKNGFTADVAEKVKDYLEDGGIEVYIFYNSESPPTHTTIAALNDLINKNKVDGVIGLGGGSSIDLAKAAAYKKTKRKERNYQSIISCPTSTAHDGIASDRASILVNDNEGNLVRKTIQTKLPIAVIADIPHIISEAPYKMNMSGVGDIISNYTAAKDWELASKNRNFKDKVKYGETLSKASKMLSYVIIQATLKLPRKINEHVYDENSYSIDRKFLRLLLLSEVASSVIMSIAGSSLPASGAEHNFSHVLDQTYPEKGTYHGEQVGAVVPTMVLLHSRNWNRYNPFFVPGKIKGVLQKVGLATSAEELGLTDKQGLELLLSAREFKKKEKYTILQEKNPHQIEKAAKKSGFIKN